MYDLEQVRSHPLPLEIEVTRRQFQENLDHEPEKNPCHFLF